MWDLPIGESHHLANSFPPEIWTRVVVVYWGQLIETRPGLFAEIAEYVLPFVDSVVSEAGPVIGLGLEFLL